MACLVVLFYKSKLMLLFFWKKFYVDQGGVLQNYYFFIIIKKPVSRQENIQIVLCVSIANGWGWSWTGGSTTGALPTLGNCACASRSPSMSCRRCVR